MSADLSPLRVQMNAISVHTNEGCTQQTTGFSGKFMMSGDNKNNCDVAGEDDSSRLSQTAL